MSRIQNSQRVTTKGKARQTKIWSVVFFLVVILELASVLYFDRDGGLTVWMQSHGSMGIIGAIVTMAVMCTTPVPSEGLLVMYIKVYGLLWGTLFAWLGFMVSTIALFFLARFLGNRTIGRWISVERFNAVDKWIDNKSVIGLLIVRLLPIPAYIVNYIAGMIPSVSFLTYVWTGAVSIIPYYVGVALMYHGFSHRYLIVIVIGFVFLLILGVLSYFVRKIKR